MGRPAWSPDSKRLVFPANNAKGGGFFLFDIATEKVHRVWKGEVWSFHHLIFRPNGRSIAFPRQDGMWSLDLDSREESKLVDESGGLSFAWDRKRFALTVWTPKESFSKLVIGDTSSGRTRELVSAKLPEKIAGSTAWTPDGGHVLFWKTNEDDEVSTLWTISSDGDEPRKTELSAKSVDPTNLYGLSLHPNGKQVAYSAGTSKYEIWALEGILSER